MYILYKSIKDTMAEWSKATDLSSVIFGCAGSNPAGVTCLVSSVGRASDF